MRLLILISIVLFSCSKQQTDTFQTPGSLNLRTNGIETKFQTSVMFKITGIQPVSSTIYDLRGESGVNNSIRLVIIADSLKMQTYLTPVDPPNLAILVLNGKTYTTGPISIRVNNYSEGRVSGSYSGKLVLLGGYEAIEVNGEFNNVQIIY